MKFSASGVNRVHYPGLYVFTGVAVERKLNATFSFFIPTSSFLHYSYDHVFLSSIVQIVASEE